MEGAVVGGQRESCESECCAKELAAWVAHGALDHPIRPHQQLGRDGETKRLGRLQVDDLLVGATTIAPDREGCKTERKDKRRTGVEWRGVNDERYGHPMWKQISEIEATPMKLEVATGEQPRRSVTDLHRAAPDILRRSELEGRNRLPLGETTEVVPVTLRNSIQVDREAARRMKEDNYPPV